MKQNTDPSPPVISERDHSVSRVLWRVLFLNLLVAVLKLVFGYFAGAVSMLADGLHSTLDASSNVMGLVGMKVARKAPDEEHPYGHRKFEALAAIGISLFLFLACYEVLTRVVQRIGESSSVHPEPITFAVMLFIGIVCSLFTAVTVTRWLLTMVCEAPWAQKLSLYGLPDPDKVENRPAE